MGVELEKVLKKFITTSLLVCAFNSMAYSHLPNQTLTPGEYASSSLSEICASGYPERARNVSETTKRRVYAMYGVRTAECRGGCKIDHLLPLSIGGSNEIANLWPHEYDQFWSVYKKTRLEVRLRREVCAQRMPLDEARTCIASDWTACYNRFYRN